MHPEIIFEPQNWYESGFSQTKINGDLRILKF